MRIEKLLSLCPELRVESRLRQWETCTYQTQRVVFESNSHQRSKNGDVIVDTTYCMLVVAV